MLVEIASSTSKLRAMSLKYRGLHTNSISSSYIKMYEIPCLHILLEIDEGKKHHNNNNFCVLLRFTGDVEKKYISSK